MARPLGASSTHIKLTLTGPQEEIDAAHIYAGRQRRSLSSLVFEWLGMLTREDKAKNPEVYGDRQAAAPKRKAAK